jgi:hypothetical protein
VRFGHVVCDFCDESGSFHAKFFEGVSSNYIQKISVLGIRKGDKRERGRQKGRGEREGHAAL